MRLRKITHAQTAITGLVAFLISSAIAVSAFFSCGFIPEKNHGVILLAASCIAWLLCATYAFTRPHIRRIAAISITAPWGFLFSLSAAISIQNQRDSINWSTMPYALIALPLILFATLAPIWYIRRRKNHTGT